MPQRFITVLQEAVQEIAETMLFMEVTQGAHSTSCADLPEEYCAVIAYSGAVEGSLRLGGPKSAALKLGGALLGEERDEMDADMMDAFGEMGNMIAGGVQTRLEAEWGAIQISPPEVRESDGTHVQCDHALSCVSHLFELEGVPFFAEIFYQAPAEEASEASGARTDDAPAVETDGDGTSEVVEAVASHNLEGKADGEETPDGAGENAATLDPQATGAMLREMMSDPLQETARQVVREEVKSRLPDVAERIVREEIERLKAEE